VCAVTILQGDCREVLKTLPPESVHCCVTSPPYWGLRDYGCERQIGLEESLEGYVSELVGVFREVRRVLRDDGTLWLNLGDSYAGTGPLCQEATEADKKTATVGALLSGAQHRHGDVLGLKPKNLCGVPWRVAFALQADGWYLRSDIIWAKGKYEGTYNPMPSSVTDRCTTAHEYIFMLSKSARYYFDAAAIAEDEECGRKRGPSEHQCSDTNGNGGLGRREGTGKRNKRDVWTVPTRGYAEAHFATFPPALIEPCILAGSPVGGVVMDPFGGSGTTAEVAATHGRDSILIELSPDYCGLISQRLAKSLFAEVT
jgi:DNA modification methylase